MAAQAETPSFPIIPSVAQNAHIRGLAQYEALYKESIENPSAFWARLARDNLLWFREFDFPMSGSLTKGDIAWFVNGKLNISVNCIDRHIPTKGDKVAIVWESDEPGHCRHITYKELLAEVCRIANAMKAAGVKKGDTVAIYMPMIPEVAFVMLACTRIGAIHSVVFAGFSSDSLRDRIVDARSQWVFTSDEGKRGGRTLPLKEIVDHAVHGLDFVRKVFVFKRTNSSLVGLNKHIDIDMSVELPKHRPYCPPEWMDSEDLMFILYTSGSTGTPKGVAHTTAGYLLYAMLTTNYIVYGPLANGATTVMFESTPVYPDPGRYWDLVQRHKITTFYTAPTAIRALMAHGDEHVKKYDRSTLRILGSVGEPINPEAWRWYYEVVGERKCYIADTYWQTETGGHVGTGLPGVTPMKPGSCTRPFFGIDFVITDDKGNIIEGNNVEGELCIRHPWPGMARTVYGDHNRYLAVYMTSHKGLYFTGDGVRRDNEGYLFITGRIDDVLSTSGHRIGTAEVESALVAHNLVAEAAVIGIPHKIKGEGICCFVTLISAAQPSPQVSQELVQQVRHVIGAFASPDVIVFAPGLPKTRSGKIMRRVLRKIAAGEEGQLGDVSTLADPAVVPILIANMKEALVGKKL
ncbi:hypothetical protein ATCC90586_010237 [Pythium insidiosum]|nr:hypothetical protein ATCC90586_010237 [Pythium insidiosum]